MDDFYALPLDKLDRYICLKKSEVMIPAEGESESSSDEDDSDDDSDDDSGEEGEGEKGDEEEGGEGEAISKVSEERLVAEPAEEITSAVSMPNLSQNNSRIETIV